MTAPIQPIQNQPQPTPPQPVAPTAPVQQAPEPIQQPQHDDEYTPSATDLMYVMASYFYIHASEIGYEALKSLNPNFVVVNSLSNKDVANARSEAEKEVAASDLEDHELELLADGADTSGEASSAGVPSDNTRHD